MQRFLLDTSAILHILDSTEKGKKAIKLVSSGEVITSIICYCEVLNKTNLDKQTIAEEFLSKLLVFQVTLEDGNIAKQFQNSCRKSGKFVPTTDCLIAATAANNKAVVVATDSDFERISGIEKIIL